MKKEKPDIETFAAEMADKEDNPSIHELAKQFPEKTYRELENYRDSDRQEEANKVPLTEAQRNLVEHIEAGQIPLTESQQKQKELEPIEDDLGTCITASMQRDKVATELQVMKRRAQEAEGELSILKGIETNRVKEAQDRSNHLQDELDRVKKENNDLFNRVADALGINESHQKLNGKLQVRVAELEDENKKMHKHLDKQVEAARKAGL